MLKMNKALRQLLVKTAAVASAASLLFSCAVSSVPTAYAFDNTSVTSGVGTAAQMLIHNDTVDTDISGSRAVYLDNSEIAGGRRSLTVTVSIADKDGNPLTSGDIINYKVSEPNNSIRVTDLTPSDVNTSVTLRIDAYVSSGGVEKPLSPGVTNITFSNRTGSVKSLLSCNVYNPATDMTLYWNKSSEPLLLNDFNRDNLTDVTAVVNHSYNLTAGVIPRDSTDRVKWAVSEGLYTGAAGTYITQTDKASITNEGLFTAESEGDVTIVAKFESTSSSPRTACFGTKQLYNSNGEIVTETVKTVPKYIHVTIVPENPAVSIDFTNIPAVLEKGKTWNVGYSLTPSDPSMGDATDVLTWESSDKNVITVDQNGKITAVGTGSATVTLYGENKNVYAEQSIRVITKATSLKLEPSPCETRAGVPTEITAVMMPFDADEEIEWSVSGDISAEIIPTSEEYSCEQKAVFTASEEGTATIYARTVYSNITASIDVSVKPRAASDSLTLLYRSGEYSTPLIDGSNIKIYTNQDITVSGLVTSPDGTQPDDDVIWEIKNNSNDYVTLISDKNNTLKLHGTSPGTITVKAYCASDSTISREFNVTVLKACDIIRFFEPDGKTLFPQIKSVNVGSLITMRADLTIEGNYPYQHSDKISSWESDRPDLAQIDQNGNVRAVGNGTAVITVYTASGKKASCRINVFTTSQVIMLNVTPSQNGELPTASIDKTGTKPCTAELGATVKDQYGNEVSDVDTTWTSSDESVVTVDNKGVATAVGIGSATITVKSGSKTDQCTLSVHAPITDAYMEEIAAQTYSPLVQSYEPRPTLTYNGIRLNEGTDYTLSYESNTGIGTGRLTVTGEGHMSRSKTVSFDIKRKDLSDEDIVPGKIEDVQCTGSEICPVPEISCSGVLLKPDVDYTCSYVNNVAAGEAAVIVNGKGNYIGSITVGFNIICDHSDTTEPEVIREPTCTQVGLQKMHCNKCNMDVQTEIPKIDHNYEEQVIPPTANERGYTLHKCTVCGTSYKDNYVEKIEGVSISDCTAIISGDSFPYTGEPVKPSIKLRYDGKLLTENADYIVIYLNNTDVGTGYAVITGLGNYVGTGKISFMITDEDTGTSSDTNVEIIMTDEDEDTDDGRISLTQDSVGILDPVVYSPEKVPFEPMSNISAGSKALIEDVDYTLAYANNTDVGTATIIMRGIGNYKGVAQFKFDILPKPITDADVTVKKISVQRCTGKAVTPATIVTCNGYILKSRQDYKVTYEKNIEPGLAIANITGINNYTGSVQVTFEIECEHNYQEQIIEPTYTARGYTLHTCSICGQSYKDNYTNQLTMSDLSECTLSLDYTSTSYSGSAKEPKVTAMHQNKLLELGKDYTVSYSRNIEPGLAEVKVRGIGGFTGLETLTFQIFEKINKGDVNSDGTVTAEDALLALRYSVGLDKLDDDQIAAADINGDGTVNAEDCLAILRYTVGLGSL